jgi:predicted Rossmann fold nucleotide-binding protein DprA/Smf involved in DNA uptake
MHLQKSTLQNLKFFGQTVSGLSRGLYDDESTEMLLQIKCKNIKMEADIAMALYPESNRRCLEIYVEQLTRYLDNIEEMQKHTRDEEQLERLDVVFAKLYRLNRFIGALLA